MELLKISKLEKKGEGDFLLRDITFSQRKLEKIAVAGETGAGKSTLMKLIAGLVQPDGGELLFEKTPVSGPADQLVPGHPGIAYLSQHFELQKSLRVEQVLSYSNTLSDNVAERLYRVCQIDHLLGRRTDQLSGGEKQRVAICRLLISSPRLLLLDEPFSHLDMMHKITLKEVIRDIGARLKVTIILVSHDPLDTLSWADRIVVMRDGRVVQLGDPETVYLRPANEYAGGLFGKYTLVPPARQAIFLRLPGFRKLIEAAPGKSIFLRPEHFRVSTGTRNTLRGKIESVSFFGAYSELAVEVGKLRILVRAKSDGLKEGQTVRLAVSSAGAWMV